MRARSTFQSIFITGTDTGIGKTTVACGLAAGLFRRGQRVGVVKPVETGCVPHAGRMLPQDAKRLSFFAECRLDLETVCPYMMPDPVAPLVAAERLGTRIEPARLIDACEAIAAQHDVTLIEGAGGLLVPIAEGFTFADLARRLEVPVLIVVGSRLGAINHALLTERVARASGLRIAGYIVNHLAEADDLATQTNVSVLTRWMGPPLGVVPYVGLVEETDAMRIRLAALFERVVALDALLLPNT